MSIKLTVWVLQKRMKKKKEKRMKKKKEKRRRKCRRKAFFSPPGHPGKLLLRFERAYVISSHQIQINTDHAFAEKFKSCGKKCFHGKSVIRWKQVGTIGITSKELELLLLVLVGNRAILWQQQQQIALTTLDPNVSYVLHTFAYA